MRYIPHTEDDIQHMLGAVGASDLDALFASVPDALRHPGPLDLGEPRSEQSVAKELRRLAAKNDALVKPECPFVPKLDL